MSKTAIINVIIDFLFFMAVVVLFISLNNSTRKQEEQPNHTKIEVNFWNPSNMLPFDSTSGIYKRIILTGLRKSDSLKLVDIKEHLKGFKAKMDTEIGVHVVFSGNSKYGDFIQVLDYCLMEGINLYTPYRNNIWIPSNGNMKK